MAMRQVRFFINTTFGSPGLMALLLAAVIVTFFL
jgi:ABC-type transporter lipoprotein component MlaA